MHKKNATVAVHCGDLLEKLVSHESLSSYTHFVGTYSVLVILEMGVILLCDKAWLHKAQQTRNLPQNFSWEMFDSPSLSLELASSNFQLFSTLKEYLFHLWWIVECAVFTCLTQVSVHLGWAYLPPAETGDSTIRGTMLNCSITLTPSVYVVSFLS